MAMNRTATAPPQVGLAYVAGLVLVFLGERVLAATPGVRWVLTGAGIGLILAYTLLRGMVSVSGAPQRRGVERMLAILAVVTLLALGLELLTTEAGERLVGLAKATAETRDRFEGIAIAVWITLLATSATTVLFAEWALFPMRRSDRIETRRVFAAAAAGLTLGLAASYGTLLTYVAGELEIKADYSYFKTSQPSDSTRKIVTGLGEPIKIVAFFPQVNDVGREVWGYLRSLAKSSPRLTVEMHDRLLEPQLAKDSKVTQDGVLVLMKGPTMESITIGFEMDKVKGKLKTLDGDLQKVLLKLARPARTAFLTTGHGELNEKASDLEGRAASLAKKVLESQNYSVRDLGFEQGLGSEVPKEATMVLVIGPSRSFLPGELPTLKKYLDGGGHVMFALDPEAKIDLEPFAELVGLTVIPGVLAHDRLHFARRYNDSDKTIIGTNRFSSHASVSTLSKSSQHALVIFPGAAGLDKRAGADAALKIDFAVKSMPDTYADANGDFVYQNSEKKTIFNLAAAVSKTVGTGKDAPEMRAFVVGDADALSDAAFSNEANIYLFIDAIRWLGGEESFAGAPSVTEDKKIEHTRQQDLVWFYGIIIGIPSIVLALGLLYAKRTRHGSTVSAGGSAA
jgi:hypothetical protein